MWMKLRSTIKRRPVVRPVLSGHTPNWQTVEVDVWFGGDWPALLSVQHDFDRDPVKPGAVRASARPNYPSTRKVARNVSRLVRDIFLSPRAKI